MRRRSRWDQTLRNNCCSSVTVDTTVSFFTAERQIELEKKLQSFKSDERTSDKENGSDSATSMSTLLRHCTTMFFCWSSLLMLPASAFGRLDENWKIEHELYMLLWPDHWSIGLSASRWPLSHLSYFHWSSLLSTRDFVYCYIYSPSRIHKRLLVAAVSSSHFESRPQPRTDGQQRVARGTAAKENVVTDWIRPAALFLQLPSRLLVLLTEMNVPNGARASPC